MVDYVGTEQMTPVSVVCFVLAGLILYLGLTGRLLTAYKKATGK